MLIQLVLVITVCGALAASLSERNVRAVAAKRRSEALPRRPIHFPGQADRFYYRTPIAQECNRHCPKVLDGQFNELGD